ncbi:MAG TPA: NUDIX hydrolase [Methylomirabilota bacterium]|nr:NUDIX hydrolase [Methylomirabilota bacterium]
MQKIIPEDSVLIPDEAKLVFQGEIFDVYQWPQEMFDGSSATFEMLKRCDTAVAICVVEDGIIVLDDEQPHAGSRVTFPGGQVDASDPDILAGAQREVLEETGYSFKNWRLVKVRQPQDKIEWFVYVFIAWEETGQQTTTHEPGEKIVVNTVPFSEVKNMVTNKVSHMGENAELLEGIETTGQLLDIPEFTGQTVDR